MAVGARFVTKSHIVACGDVETSRGWEEDTEAGDTSISAAKASERDAAVVFLRDALADPESEAGTLC